MESIDETSIEFCIEAANISNTFELTNSDLKKRYILGNIKLANIIMQSVYGYRGSFGTGYPFYALGDNFEGQLPVIDEQLRYNNELINYAVNSGYSTWPCAECLSKNYENMPNLKKECLPCSKVINELKPRKIINRLPDIDMWIVCDDDKIEKAKKTLCELFKIYRVTSSDIDPIQTVKDVGEIAELIKNGILPLKTLPIDFHIIGYSQLLALINEVPTTIKNALENGIKPYLPIQPISYRKVWQLDADPYNFINDFLINFTDFNFDPELKQALTNARLETSLVINEENLDDLLSNVLAPSTLRRFETPELANYCKRRIKRWGQK